jgi:hypothetical protein
MSLQPFAHKFDPKPGSFWEADHKMPRVAYVADPSDGTKCIGKIEDLGPGRYRTTVYKPAVAFTSPRKTAPVAESTVIRHYPSAARFYIVTKAA